jgi:hypothetical protein
LLKPVGESVMRTGTPGVTVLDGFTYVTERLPEATLTCCEIFALWPYGSVTVTMIVCVPSSCAVGVQLNAPLEFISEETTVLPVPYVSVTEYAIGTEKPFGTAVKVTGLPTATEVPGIKVWIDTDGVAVMVTVSVAADALPELSRTLSVIVCVPISCTDGVQLNTPLELMFAFESVVPAKESVSVKVGFENPAVVSATLIGVPTVTDVGGCVCTLTDGVSANANESGKDASPTPITRVESACAVRRT